jgi:lipopolysaccharide export LptBFGC system permease protein LptF
MEDGIQSMALLDEDELLGELGETINEIILPQADAGDDKVISAAKDGKIVVLLDGGTSFDPQNRITRWSWIESSGREISTSKKVKVKLSKGRHSFELRVQSGEGNWTSDVLSVIIE